MVKRWKLLVGILGVTFLVFFCATGDKAAAAEGSTGLHERTSGQMASHSVYVTDRIIYQAERDSFQWLVSSDTVVYSIGLGSTIGIYPADNLDIYDVWVKETYTSWGVRDIIIPERVSKNLPVAGYDALDHALVHYRIAVFRPLEPSKDKAPLHLIEPFQYRVNKVQGYHYDVAGKLLGDLSSDANKWQIAAPNSENQMIAKAVHNFMYNQRPFGL